MSSAVSVHAVWCEREGPMCRAGRGRGAAACALLLLAAALAGASAISEKRSDMSPVPFVMGSRYGRSSPRLMSPRNDKFFMGSRYGKRSEPLGAPAPAPAVSASAGGMGGGGGLRVAGVSAGALVCQYTGVFPLYRCVKHHKRTRLNRRSFEDTGANEGE